MLEVYNENVSDLLTEDAEESKKLQIMTKGKSVIVPVRHCITLLPYG